MNLDKVPYPKSGPAKKFLIGETRAALDFGSVPLQLARSLISNRDEGRHAPPAILFPGFASDGRYLLPLRQFLLNLGYRAEDWGLGVNLAGKNLPHKLEDISEAWEFEVFEGYDPADYQGEGGVPYLCDQAREQVKQRAQELNEKVVLIGWSLGGYVAREAARDLPDLVDSVITFGSPIIGGPKYTRAAKLFESNGKILDWIERESAKREKTLIKQPITAIYSKSDGVVDWRATIDRVNPNVTHHAVRAAHLGMGFNHQVWRLVRQALRRRQAQAISV